MKRLLLIIINNSILLNSKHQNIMACSVFVYQANSLPTATKELCINIYILLHLIGDIIVLVSEIWDVIIDSIFTTLSLFFNVHNTYMNLKMFIVSIMLTILSVIDFVFNCSYNYLIIYDLMRLFIISVCE